VLTSGNMCGREGPCLPEQDRDRPASGRGRCADRPFIYSKRIREERRRAELVKAHAVVPVHWLAVELMEVTSQGSS
jgi:hypothetical protein